MIELDANVLVIPTVVERSTIAVVVEIDVDDETSVIRVVTAASNRLFKNCRVACHAKHSEFGDQTRKLAIRQNAALNVVVPETLPTGLYGEIRIV